MQGAPDVAEMHAAAAALGMRYRHTAPGLPLWAEHVQVAELFAAMRTQWVLDAQGQPSLNYAALQAVEARLRIPARVSRRIFPDLRQMEAAGREWLLSR